MVRWHPGGYPNLCPLRSLSRSGFSDLVATRSPTEAAATVAFEVVAYFTVHVVDEAHGRDTARVGLIGQKRADVRVLRVETTSEFERSRVDGCSWVGWVAS